MKQCNCRRCVQKRREEEKNCENKKNHVERCHPEMNDRPTYEKYTKETIYEKPVFCTVEENHHHHVKHVVPVIYKKVEHHHRHHEYVIEKKYKEECKEHDHGKFEGNFCELGRRCGEKPNREIRDCDCE